VASLLELQLASTTFVLELLSVHDGAFEEHFTSTTPKHSILPSPSANCGLGSAVRTSFAGELRRVHFVKFAESHGKWEIKPLSLPSPLSHSRRCVPARSCLPLTRRPCQQRQRPAPHRTAAGESAADGLVRLSLARQLPITGATADQDGAGVSASRRPGRRRGGRRPSVAGFSREGQ
jgi:hypothetical protein